MTETDLLARALYSSAIIHQPHALKAVVAAQHLFIVFDNDDTIWTQTDALIAIGSVTTNESYFSAITAPQFSQTRIKKILAQGIYPAAYQALSQWHDQKGFADIFEYYLPVALSHNEYLSHNVTLLLAFRSLYPQLNERQVPPFLNRVTEYISSTYGGLKASALVTPRVYSQQQLLEVCLAQPSFFGHNLISLAWILRSKHLLDEQQLNILLSNLYQQATQPLEDVEDCIDEVIMRSVDEQANTLGLLHSLHHLVFGTRSNLHQVTLADALYYLQQLFPDTNQELDRIARYYVAWLGVEDQ
ncbi:hypothetical protein DBZ36_12625 [Alginatibacterium sediminis]|uniref:Uncharacterized protein n=1 Tax=Alginatibacterium sediminis TaxID=2164068 RepID=A0A420EBK2_9ALTE|nr:hypothetical protein [Alginatibacterium sediminis]RKF18077.1 hypothetical protein DBZ36_12625 [Alginatibacterium sediminis]